MPMRILPVLLLLAVAPGFLSAQEIAGFPGDVVPYPVNGKIATGGYDHYESPPISASKESVFMYQFAQQSDDLNFTMDPGFDNLAGFNALPVGQPLDFTLTTKLYYWDGNGAVSFSPAPASSQLFLSLGSYGLDITGEAVTGSLTTIQVSNSIGRLHTHLGATIADGSPQGIYMIGMQLTMPGLIASDPIAIMYNDLQTLLTSPDPNDFAKAEQIGQTAANWTQQNLGIVGIPGDVNYDGIVNAQDLALVSSNWLRNTVTGDANGDGIVNAQDLALISSNWLNTFVPTSVADTATATSVPEPSTYLSAALGGLVLCLAACRRWMQSRG